jgi:hypothetical protein
MPEIDRVPHFVECLRHWRIGLSAEFVVVYQIGYQHPTVVMVSIAPEPKH